jgi:hypothetical protein
MNRQKAKKISPSIFKVELDNLCRREEGGVVWRKETEIDVFLYVPVGSRYALLLAFAGRLICPPQVLVCRGRGPGILVQTRIMPRQDTVKSKLRLLTCCLWSNGKSEMTSAEVVRNTQFGEILMEGKVRGSERERTRQEGRAERRDGGGG